MQPKRKYTPKSSRLLRKRYKGQSMVVIGVILATGVLIGLVAIAFDGGSALLQRRTMQNGAEAGAIAGGNYLSNNLAVSCNPSPCHPTYLVTNQQLLDQVTTLTQANRGGTVGATDSDYTTLVEYHYMDGHVPSIACPEPGHSAGYCPMPQNAVYPFVPEFVDGLQVTASVNNPTTFAKAIPNPLSNLTVGGKAAVLLFPTCAPQSQQGDTLPFTRYRPAVEKELHDASGGNSVCHVFPFWVASPDVGSSNKNVMSFDHDTLHVHDNIQQQMITGFDDRAGPEVWPNPPWPASGLSDYDHANLGRTYQHCLAEPCVNMYNAGVPQGGSNPGAPTITDLANWVFWQWRGILSTDSTAWNQLQHSQTLYPSTRQNGASGNVQRPGDWVETADITGNGGQNIQEAVHDLADQYGIETALSTELNWGRAITRTVYVWGEPAPDPANGIVPGDDKSAQIWDSWDNTNRNPCAGGQSNTSAWTDLSISGNYPSSGPSYSASNVSCGNGPRTIDRVRFTKAYTFVFYANLQGNYGAEAAPSCPALPNSGSAAWGILPDVSVPDPGPGGGCSTGWEPGGGVYPRQVPPGP